MELGLEIKRELTEEDLAALQAPPASPAQIRLKKLRDTHHALARAIASGMSESEAAAVTGYSLVRVSILKHDPAFQELIAQKRKAVDDAYASFHGRMASFATDIIDELRERFEDDPEAMSVKTLHELLETFADRTGHGPRSTQVNVNVSLASRLESARERAGLTSRPKDLELEVIK